MVPDICCDFALTRLLSTDPNSAVPGRDYPMTQLSSEVRGGGGGERGGGVGGLDRDKSRRGSDSDAEGGGRLMRARWEQRGRLNG